MLAFLFKCLHACIIYVLGIELNNILDMWFDYFVFPYCHCNLYLFTLPTYLIVLSL